MLGVTDAKPRRNRIQHYRHTVCRATKTDAVLGPPKERSERPMPKTDAYARPKQDSVQTRNLETNTPNCSESPMPQIALLGINLLF